MKERNKAGENGKREGEGKRGENTKMEDIVRGHFLVLGRMEAMNTITTHPFQRITVYS